MPIYLNLGKLHFTHSCKTSSFSYIASTIYEKTLKTPKKSLVNFRTLRPYISETRCPIGLQITVYWFFNEIFSAKHFSKNLDNFELGTLAMGRGLDS